MNADNKKYRQGWAVIDFSSDDHYGVEMRTIDYFEAESEADEFAAELAAKNPSSAFLVVKTFYHVP